MGAAHQYCTSLPQRNITKSHKKSRIKIVFNVSHYGILKEAYLKHVIPKKTMYLE